MAGCFVKNHFLPYGIKGPSEAPTQSVQFIMLSLCTMHLLWWVAFGLSWFSRRRWTIGSAQKSNKYGMMHMLHNFLVFVISTTAYHLGRYSIHLLLQKCSMLKIFSSRNIKKFPKKSSFQFPKSKKVPKNNRFSLFTCLSERIAEGRLRLRDHCLDLPVGDLGAAVPPASALIHLLEL